MNINCMLTREFNPICACVCACVAELQLHKQRVDAHCQQVSDVLASCTAALQELQTSTYEKNRRLTATLGEMEDSVLKTDGSQR